MLLISGDSFIHSFTHSLTYSVVPWTRVLLEMLEGPQLFNKFLVIYRTWKFIIEFTIYRHLSLSWARLNQSKYPSPNPTLYSNLRLSRPSGLLHLGFSAKILYAPRHLFMRATCPNHLNLLEVLIINWNDGGSDHRSHQIRGKSGARIFTNAKGENLGTTEENT